MTITKTLFVAGTLIFISACGKTENRMANSETALGYNNAGAKATELNMEAAPALASDKSIPAEPKITEQKLIKNGEISFETKNIPNTKAFLQKTVLKYSGYMANEKIQDYRVDPTEVLTVRVPNANFDKLIADIGSQVGEFDSKRIDIDDVTAEFVDIEARLKNKKQLETKYQQLLAKANNMTDILKIEKEISLIREDIESTEGRLRYLSNQVGYSTLIITYYEKKATAGFHFWNKITDALADGGMGFLWFLIAITHLWPLWLVGGIVWYIIKKLRKRKKNTI